MKKLRKMVASIVMLSVAFCMVPGMSAQADTCGGLEEVDVYTPGEDEVIQDPVLHWAVRSAMNAIKARPKLTAEMVGDPSVKNISYEQCNHPEDFEQWTQPYWIEDLSGLEYAKSAKMIDIGYTSSVEGKSIKDLRPLSGLTQLEELILKQDGITDISPVKNLVNLTVFDVSVNREIQDVSAIADMTKLKKLNISFNKVENIDAISGLVSLEYADVSKNNISTLPDMSKLEKLTALNISHNNLTDISALADAKNLTELNLKGNTGVTDLKPLAELIYLEKDKTFLPDDSKKDDLFAAIAVNQLFWKFNISKMTTSDLENVGLALEAYEALTADQKAYMDSDRVKAAEDNKEKVENGQAPDYYPEYDEGGEKQPIWNRIVIKVVDKYGNPMPNVAFEKTMSGSVVKEAVTDENGVLSIAHTTLDYLGECVIAPKGDTYVAIPEQVTYTVLVGGITESINGKLANGFEELEMVLWPKDEYVDKSALQNAIESAGSVEEQYKYTADSYATYQEALTKAQQTYDDVDATKEETAEAEAKLTAAINGLTKTDILTRLKLIVKDENGNLFTRPFKFQIRVPDTGAEAWNDKSDAYTGTAYLQASPGWQDGKEWEVLACYEEPYEIEPFRVTIGVKDGQRYFKTVDGEAVGVDFEKQVVARGIQSAEATIQPDGTVLQAYIEKAKAYDVAEWMPSTWKVLQEKITAAENAVNTSGATQEVYNQCAAELLRAMNGLKPIADKTELKKQVELEYSYSETSFTATSWQAYQVVLQQAKAVLNNGDAEQQQVDDAVAALKEARSQLVVRANTKVLEQKISEAKALNSDDYESGFDALLAAIADAEAVCKNADATQGEVDARVTAISNAIAGLVKKPVEVDYSCVPGVFKAKVIDENGQPLEGVKFDAYVDGRKVEDTYNDLKSTSQGIIQWYVTSGETYIKLADDRFTTQDEHWFVASGTGWICTMTSIDGKPYAEGTKLTYTLKKSGGETPDPGEAVLSDKKAFRAKVVDESGNPVGGVSFTQTPDYQDVTLSDITSNDNGVIEYTVTGNDGGLKVEIRLKEGQAAGENQTWSCEEIHTYQTNFVWPTPAITSVDDVSVDETTEIVYTLKKVGSSTPEPGTVDKSKLKERLDVASLFDGKEADYTAESYQALQSAKAAAQLVYDKVDATQPEVDEEYQKLDAAIKGMKEVEKPIVTDKSNIRILVVDENGQKVTDSIAFALKQDSYAGTAYSANGVVEYTISDADQGVAKITVSLKNESVVINGKEYYAEPASHEFTLSSSSLGVVITTVDGEVLEDTREVKFVLKEKEVGIDTDKLESELQTAKAIEQGNYTRNSYNTLQSAISAAEGLLKSETLTQQAVNDAEAALVSAREGLKEVTGMRTLQIPVEGDAPANLEFVRYDVKYSVANKLFANDGALTWAPGIYDEGEYEFYLPDTSAYIATPGLIKVQVEKEDGTPVIKTINGVPAAEAEAKFVISAKGTDTSDILTFRALVQDDKGNALSGLKFNIEFKQIEQTVVNAEKEAREAAYTEEVISDENGIISYQVTMWDTNTEATVSLQDGQGWTTDQVAVFSVIADPADPDRAIIEKINGAAPADQKVVFKIQEEGGVPAPDRTRLDAAMEQAAKIDASLYTEESYLAVTTALEAARKLGDGAAQEELDNAAQAIEAAIGALQKKDPKPVEPENPGEPDRPGETDTPDSGNGNGNQKPQSQNSDKTANNQKAVKTGDSAQTLPLLAVMIMSLCVLGVSLKKRCR